MLFYKLIVYHIHQPTLKLLRIPILIQNRPTLRLADHEDKEISWSIVLSHHTISLIEH